MELVNFKVLSFFALQITPQVDLPVGQNLQDHSLVTFQFLLPNNTAFVPRRDLKEQAEVDYLKRGTGMSEQHLTACCVVMTQIGHNVLFVLNISGPYKNLVSATGFYSSALNSPNPQIPDIQYFFVPQPYQLPTTISLDPNAPTPPDANIISIYLVKPKSVGTVKLSSSNPSDPLLVNPNYVNAQEDLPALIDGVKFIVDLYENTQAYQSVGGAHLDDANFPAMCTSLGYRTPAYWECMVRLVGTAGHHFVGTVKMGKSTNDPTAVVDSRLR